jgi:hypothetical protein
LFCFRCSIYVTQYCTELDNCGSIVETEDVVMIKAAAKLCFAAAFCIELNACRLKICVICFLIDMASALKGSLC